jgi:hypothetical protein
VGNLQYGPMAVPTPATSAPKWQAILGWIADNP